MNEREYTPNSVSTSSIPHGEAVSFWSGRKIRLRLCFPILDGFYSGCRRRASVLRLCAARQIGSRGKLVGKYRIRTIYFPTKECFFRLFLLYFQLSDKKYIC